MKKILCFLLACFLIAGCKTTMIDDNFTKERVEGIVNITYEELTDKINNNVDFILYIGRSDCGDCIEFEPLITNHLNGHPSLGVYYLDVKEFRDQANSENATDQQKEFFKNIYKTLDFDWTPTLQHRRGDKVLTKITYLSMDYYEIEDEKLQEQEKEENLKEIYSWLEKECN